MTLVINAAYTIAKEHHAVFLLQDQGRHCASGISRSSSLRSSSEGAPCNGMACCHQSITRWSLEEKAVAADIHAVSVMPYRFADTADSESDFSKTMTSYP